MAGLAAGLFSHGRNRKLRMSPNDQAECSTKVLWLGSVSNEFGWVIDRIASAKSHSFTIETFSALGEIMWRLADGQADRIILAPENRYCYPDDLISQLNAQYPELPIAVCLGDYWLGWKRTGAGHLKTLHHSSIHWYRWYDGWLPWLLGIDANLFGPFPADRFQLQFCNPIYPMADGSSVDSKVVLFCADHAVAEAWGVALGQSTNLEVVNGPAADVGCEQFPDGAEFVLWDDSRLSTWNGSQHALELAMAELKAIAAKFPTQLIWICWTQPSWQAWQQLAGSGLRFELLAKPQLFSFSSAALART